MNSRTFIAWIMVLLLLLGILSVEAAAPQRRSMVTVVFILSIAGAVMPLTPALVLGFVMALAFGGMLAVDWQYGVVTSGDIFTLGMLPIAPVFLSRLRRILDSGEVSSRTKRRRAKKAMGLVDTDTQMLTIAYLNQRNLLSDGVAKEGSSMHLWRLRLTNFEEAQGLLGTDLTRKAREGLLSELARNLPDTVVCVDPDNDAELYLADYAGRDTELQQIVDEATSALKATVGFKYDLKRQVAKNGEQPE